MTSPNVPSPGGPITQVPYDILMEIFVHCLPQESYPLRQPDTRIAPMLLRHVCSLWRTLALASPSLWTHLSHFHFLVQEYHHSTRDSAEHYTYEPGEPGMEFIRWWKTNQGQIAPSLNLHLRNYRHPNVRLKITESNAAFLLEYLTSAQYLDLDIFYWHWIHNNLKAGYPVLFSNLHTVLIVDKGSGIFEPNLFYQLPAPAFPALRRLSIIISQRRALSDFAIPTHWSGLTHLSLRILTSLKFWVCLIRAVPCLRFGSFELSIGSMISSADAHTPPPCPQCTLPELTTLSVSLHYTDRVHLLVPLSVLFTGLHLPSLRTLSLSAPDANVWENLYALRTVYIVLSAAPAVTKLALEYTRSLIRNTAIAIPPTIEPIWAHATKLAHLQLALPPKFMETEERDEVLRLFVRHIFSSASVWLDLHNPACPIRAITISDSGSALPIGDLIMAHVRESAGKAPEVAFEITSESACQAAAYVQKEWGARI